MAIQQSLGLSKKQARQVFPGFNSDLELDGLFKA
jgi:ABC-type sulfate transport system substrate-binding protein